MRSVLLSPHHDDEILFASFTIARAAPDVVVVLESHVQHQRACGQGTREAKVAALRNDPEMFTDERRRAETIAALMVYGNLAVDFWPYRDDKPDWAKIAQRIADMRDEYDHVYAPAPFDGGHDHHNTIGTFVKAFIPQEQRTLYTTYQNGGYRCTGHPVEYEHHWVGLKLRALACYTSQIALWPHHFLSEQLEYYA